MSDFSGRRGAPRRRRSPSRKSDGSAETILDSSTAKLTSFTALPPVDPPTGFAELGVPERIDIGLAAAGFAQPFMIQTAAIPVAMAGHDVCGRARTGSGKTLAFGIPMMSRIVDEARPIHPLGIGVVLESN